MLNDLKYALRIIRKYPFSNGIIVFTIACLVAVVGLMFASFRMQSGQQMPFEDPERFVRLWRVSKNASHQQFPSDIYHEFKEQMASYAKMGAMEPWSRFTLTGAGEATTLTAVKCTAEVLEMTGMKPLQGRFFSKVDEEPGNDEIVVLSKKIWDKHFASDPDILGKPITLNDKPYIVVGVAPEELYGTRLAYNSDLWIPKNWPKKAGERPASIQILARIKPNLTQLEAQAELNIIAPRVEEERPKHKNEIRYAGTSENEVWSAKVAPLDEYLNSGRGANSEQIFAMVFAFTLMGCVVLIACFNMTSLFLVQATSRAREIAVRLSVGANRFRIVRQMLLESVVLSVCGGALGLMLSFWLLKLGESENVNLTFDPYLYATAFGSAVIIGGMVCILPAWRAGKQDLSVALKDGGQSSATRQRHRLRNFLVGSQVGMATILTVAAVLFARSFLYVFLTPLNFDPSHLVAVTINPEHRLYKGGEAISRLANEALLAVSEMPGVEKAAVSNCGVTSGWNASNRPIFRDNSLNQGDGPRSTVNHVSLEFCDLIGMTLRKGRPLSENKSERLNQALINQTFVQKYFPEGVDPIGHEIRMDLRTSTGTKENWVTITGIINDRNPRLIRQQVHPGVYVSVDRPISYTHQITTLVETKADAKEFGLAVRETLKRLNKSQPVGAFITVEDIIETQLEQQRIPAYIFTGMASFGVFMALMGVYGVVAFAVIERTREMGIRMALGATRTMVMKMIMKEGTRLLIRGLLPGIIIAYVVTHRIPNNMIQNVDPAALSTYLIGFIAVALCGTIAALLPARKIVKLNPSEALHHE
jgi:putative ABC transport system permease protein